LNVLDSHLVEQVAAALGTEPGLVEKEWHVVRAIAVLASLDHGDVRPAFSGGTSLSVAWGLIKRFSEDIDFKIAMPDASSASQARAQRRRYRAKVLAALIAADFRLIGGPISRNESTFFAAHFAYPNTFDPVAGLRPYLQVEMTFQTPALPPIKRSIRSLVAQAQKQDPEIAAFLCVDPVETAADKLSALAWRVCTRVRDAEDDDPTMIRHLHDLAALERLAQSAPTFNGLLMAAMAADAGRGRGRVPVESADRFSRMFELLAGDPLWADEYDRFVRDKSFATPGDTIPFAAALEAARRLVKLFPIGTAATAQTRTSFAEADV
jgi:hypothetical protein